MKKLILIIMGLVCAGAIAHAQSPPEIEPLHIGDTVPDITLSHIINYKNTTAKLSDFRGKVLVLDFWNTWCGSCIAGMPKLQKVQDKAGAKAAILLITSESENRVREFFLGTKNESIKRIHLPIVVEDSLLNDLFSHSSVPHDVIISPQGVVEAITYSSYITNELINDVFNNKMIFLPVKGRLQQYKRMPPILSRNYHSRYVKHEYYYSTIEPYIEGMASSYSESIDTGLGLRMTSIINCSIFGLYVSAWNEYFPRTYFVWDTKDKSKIIYTNSNRNGDYRSWLSTNGYCFESVYPLSVDSVKRMKLMRRELNAFFSINGRIEMRMMNCFILACTNPARLKTKGEKHVNTLETQNKVKECLNAPISDIVWELNNNGDNLPVVDETNIKTNIDLRLHLESFKITPSLLEEFRKNGLDLIRVKRKLKVFVFSDSKSQLLIDN